MLLFGLVCICMDSYGLLVILTIIFYVIIYLNRIDQDTTLHVIPCFCIFSQLFYRVSPQRIQKHRLLVGYVFFLT